MKIVMYSGGYDSTVLLEYLQKTFEVIPYHVIFKSTNILNIGETKKVHDNKADIHYSVLNIKKGEDDYIPARNSLLLFSAINKYYGREPLEIYFGFIKNFPYYKDASPEWIKAVNTFLEIEFPNVKVFAPFINKTKDELFKIGCSLGVDTKDTFSCNFETNGEPCGKCPNCLWYEKHKYKEYRRI